MQDLEVPTLFPSVNLLSAENALKLTSHRLPITGIPWKPGTPGGASRAFLHSTGKGIQLLAGSLHESLFPIHQQRKHPK